MGWRGRILLCVSVALCVGCAGPSTSIPGLSSDEVASERRKQQIFQIQNYFSQLARLINVSHRLTLANRADCKEAVAPRLGLFSIAAHELPDRYKGLAAEALNLDADKSTVLSMAEGGPAAKAGISVGDVLLAFNGEDLPGEKPSEWIEAFLKRNGNRPVRIDVKRSGKKQTYTVPTVTACSIPILLKTDDQLNAFTDGRRIVIHSGILRVAQTDAELAVIVGHELAHVTMGHLRKLEQNRAAGTVGGAIVDIGLALLGVNTGGAFMRSLGDAGANAYATDFEREADYVGVYYVARAGYDTSTSEKIWRSLAQESPKQIFYAGLHPTSPERFLLIQKANEEIADKKRRNVPLVPEAKPSQVSSVSETASAPN